MLNCIVPIDSKVELIEALHKDGGAQVDLLEDAVLEKEGIARDLPLERVNEVSLLLIRMRSLADLLARFDKRQRNMIEDFLEIDKVTKTNVSDLGYKEVINRAAKLLDAAESEIKGIDAGMRAAEDRMGRLSEEEKRLKKFAGFDIDTEALNGSKRLSLVLASLPAQKKGEYIQLESAVSPSVLILGGSNEKSWQMAALVVPAEMEGNAEKAFRDVGGEIVKPVEGGKPKEAMNILAEKREVALKEKEYFAKRLKEAYIRHYQEILVCSELLSIEKIRCEVFYSFGKTKRAVYLRIWVPAGSCERIEKIIKRCTGGAALVNKDAMPSNAPVLLDNSWIARPFESLVHLFGTPKYNEIDPTVFFVFFFPLFFGFMLTDAVYGAVLICLALFIRKKYARISYRAKNVSLILLLCGISTVGFGILTGSYLGDFAGKYMLGQETGSQAIALWADPMFGSNAIMFMAVVFGIGFAQLYVGFFLGAYDNLKKGNIKLAMTHHISWFVLLLGGLIAAGTMFPAESPMLPKAYANAGFAICGIAVLLQFIGKKGMFFSGLTGMVGNVLSYARLIAMALTTSGIALSFNVLADLSMQIPYIGVLIAIFVFMAGHTINFVLNVMGAFVQAMRLQYVEWFSTFYEGGGIKFKPFRENRRYTIKGA